MNEVVLHVPTVDLLVWLRELSRYFAQFTLDGSAADPYSKLLRRLHELDVIAACTFASLNYECLLEIAANEVGIGVAYEAGDDGQMEVLKIHGSSNFITDDLTSQRYLLTSPGSALGCRLTAIPPNDFRTTLDARFDGQSGYFPVTSLYAWGKNSPVAGVQIQAIRNRFTEVVRNASVVVIIGVRSNNQDSHIWTSISQTSAEVCCVGPVSMVAGWRNANAHARSVGERFEDSIDAVVGCLHI